MAIRRQGWTVKWEDDGTTPVSDLTTLRTGESIFYDNPGSDNTLKSRNRTKENTIQHMTTEQSKYISSANIDPNMFIHPKNNTMRS